MHTDKQKPNILLIQVDQMTAKALPMYGHPQVQTPHLSALAAEGVVFQNGYTNFPLCAPSRMSMLTGLYSSAIEVWDNASEASPSQPTLMHYLRDLGYATILAGKMHFVGPDQLHGYEERLTTDIYPSNFTWTPNWEYGEGDRPTGINLTGVTEAGTCVRSLQMDYDDEVEYFTIRKLYDLARYEPRPFFLTVSFTQPHSPFVAKSEHWSKYQHDEITLPDVPPIPVEKMDAMSRWIYYAHAGDQLTPTEEEVRTARHAYYAMISDLDEKVGRLIDTLKNCDFYNNTIIIFTSDHGDMLGERGQWYKQLFYEWSARIPYIFAWPGHIRPGAVDANVSLVDLMPTLLDLVTNGQPPATIDEMHGQSLGTFLRTGQCADWDDIVISEYTGEGTCAPCRMVKQGTYKYIYTHGHPDILYDLSSDPLELHNAALELPHVLNRLRSIALDGWNPSKINEKILQDQRRRLLINRATHGEPVWAYKVLDNDDVRYVRKAGATQTKALARFPRVDAGERT